MYPSARLVAALFVATILAVSARALPGPVDYNPIVKVVQGQQPLTASYVLTVTAPVEITTGATVNVAFTVLKKPGSVLASTAATFISAAPATLTFTAPNQRLETVITVAVPVGSFAGDYAWQINTVGWPAGVPDVGATVNATVSPPKPPNSPVPSIAILTPPDLATAVYTQGGSPVTFPINLNATVPAGGQPIVSLSATFAGQVLTVTPSGLGTLSATGTATTPPITTAGTYTIRVSAQNSSGTSYATADVIVTVTPTPTTPPFCADLQWLPPISLNKTIKGGSTMPIKFTLSCAANHLSFVRDTTLVIAIYEDSVSSVPILYHYGTGSPNPPDYAIDGNHYQLNFPTARGTHRYRIEVYHPLSAAGTPVQLLGTKELNTSDTGGAVEDDDDDDSNRGEHKKEKDDNRGDH